MTPEAWHDLGLVGLGVLLGVALSTIQAAAQALMLWVDEQRRTRPTPAWKWNVHAPEPSKR